jgi:hypothetical protein
MTLTAEERAAINRENARKSTGPKTAEGKAASRRNALKHGLRAEVLALPNEDPAAVAARSDSWNDYYRPQSPAAQHLVNQCVAATLLADRCNQYHAAAVAKQVREAGFNWEVARQDEVTAAVALLKTDPQTAARRLTRTGHGCRWLADRWEALIAVLDVRGWWTAIERDDAIRMQGLDVIGNDPEAWLQILYSTACCETPSPAILDWLFQPGRVPEAYRGDYDCEDLPAPDVCRRGLREMAAYELANARFRETAHREEADDADRAEAADRALILHDGPSSRLFLRYHSEARTAFQRAYGSLVKTLDRDASSETDTDIPTISPDEAETAAAIANSSAPASEATPPPPATAVSPDEAVFDHEGDEIPADWTEEDKENYDLIYQALAPRTRKAATARPQRRIG